MPYPILTAEEAAELIPNNAMVGLSGFTCAGAPKAIPIAISKRAEKLHRENKLYKIGFLSGASTGIACDEALCDSEVISWRAPYHSSPKLRKLINEEKLDFIDMHLSCVPRALKSDSMGKMYIAIIEATEITSDGEVYLTTGIGSSPTFLQEAEYIIIELNSYHSPDLRKMSDIFTISSISRQSIPIIHSLSKIGVPYAKVDPKKVLGIVYTDIPDCPPGPAFTPSREIHYQIGENVIQFLLNDMSFNYLPIIQSGVGNTCNAMLYSIMKSNEFPNFKVYTEVLQDAMLDLIKSGFVIGASTCSLTLSDDKLQTI